MHAGSAKSMAQASGKQSGSSCQMAGDRQCLLARRKGYERYMDAVVRRKLGKGSVGGYI